MNKTAINNKIYRNTKTNISSYPMADMTDDENAALDRVASLILHADKRWQFDDNNDTDLPIAVADLVAGQQDYSLNTAHLDVYQVAIKDTSGQWRVLDPIDQVDLSNTDLNASNGVPCKFDKIGSSIFLYPMPSYAQDASLKLWFKRGPSYFTTADTTKSPGFNALYHELIALWPSYDYCTANGLSNASALFAKIERLEAALINDYAYRGPEAIVLRTKSESSR